MVAKAIYISEIAMCTLIVSNRSKTIKVVDFIKFNDTAKKTTNRKNKFDLLIHKMKLLSFLSFKFL
eukprot:snap_masked-scaffold_8-processed-gene-2.23-mRNA-1 protein AED:1.00 eAED:1.00 QI:0/-1/0/0/-1/1/1/0/65